MRTQRTVRKAHVLFLTASLLAWGLVVAPSGNAPNGGFLNTEEVDGAWSALGTSPLNDRVLAIAISASGTVYVGGDFTDAGGDPNADYIARFDGTTWSALGTTPLNGVVRAIALGELGVYAGGSFTNAGDEPNADHIARFTGGEWEPLDPELNGQLNGAVNAIAISANTVYAGGSFSNAGGDGNANRIAKFDGDTWSALGTGLTGTVNAIAIDGSTVYVGGDFTDVGGDVNLDYLAKFSGGNWSALGPGLVDPVLAMAISEGDVYVGRDITPPYCLGGANPPPCPFFGQSIFKFSGGNRSEFGPTLVGHVDVNAIAISESGDLYIGGRISDAGGEANADGIAILRSGSWSALGSVYLTHPVNSFPIVSAIAIKGNDVYAGGDFTNAGNDDDADRIAKFTIPAGYASAFGSGSIYDFSLTTVGTAVTTSLRVDETGDGQLDVATAQLSSDLTAGIGAFSITAGAPPFSIANGGPSRSITLQCLSSTAGIKTAIITLTHNAAGSPVSYPLSCKVNRADTTIQIVSDGPDPSVVGQAYDVSYTVTSAGGTPTGGSVTVRDDTGVGCDDIPLEFGSGSCRLTSTSAGNRTLTATYSGDVNFNGKESPSASHMVERANTTTTITSFSPDPSLVGNTVVVNYAVTVNAPGSGMPTGNVRVRDRDDGTVVCEGPAPVGECDLRWTSEGIKRLQAVYTDDNSPDFNNSQGFAQHTVDSLGSFMIINGRVIWLLVIFSTAAIMLAGWWYVSQRGRP